MARARTIKPGFFSNDVLAECDPLARILFAGLWCNADREGRLEERPKRLKAAILPYDDGVDVDGLLRQLSDRGFIERYSSEGHKYIQILEFIKHQNPHHMEPPSEIPPPDGQKNRFNHTPISPKQRARIYERDNHRCVLCGVTENLQIDHIHMVSLGGSSDDSNLRTLCRQCNLKRNSKDERDKQPLNGDGDDCLNPITYSPFPSPLSSNSNPDGLLVGAEVADADPPAWSMVEAYNAVAGKYGLPKVEKITPERRRKAAIRLREIGGWPGWERALAKLGANTWMHGDNDRGWRADFDFLMQPKSLMRLIEGGYDRASSNGHSDGGDLPERRRPAAPPSAETLGHV